jgi:hypothetical protein
MRFRVKFIEYRAESNRTWGVYLEENDVASDGKDCWSQVDSNHSHSRDEALAGLKQRMVRDHEERMRAIEAAT